MIDGDTFICQDGTRVRLLFVDTPEREQPGGARATAALEQLVRRGDVLRLESDGLDRYDRTLAYVWQDTMLVNRSLVEQGYAVFEDYGGDPRCRAALERAEREAQEHGRGLWAEDAFRCRPRAWRAGRCRSR